MLGAHREAKLLARAPHIAPLRVGLLHGTRRIVITAVEPSRAHDKGLGGDMHYA